LHCYYIYIVINYIYLSIAVMVSIPFTAVVEHGIWKLAYLRTKSQTTFVIWKERCWRNLNIWRIEQGDSMTITLAEDQD